MKDKSTTTIVIMGIIIIILIVIVGWFVYAQQIEEYYTQGYVDGRLSVGIESLKCEPVTITDLSGNSTSVVNVRCLG